MDPVSIVGILAASAQIAQFIGQTIQGLSTLKGKFSDADITIRLLIGQLSTIRAAVSQVHDWAQYNSNDSPKEEEYLKGLGVALDGCHAAMEVLDEEIKDLVLGVAANGDSNKPLSLSFLTKAKVIWSEDIIKTHRDRLHSQVQALQLLLQAGQCHSSTKQLELLQLKENRRIIKKVEDDTRTIREAMSATGSQAGVSTRSHRTSTIGDTEFDFDPSLLQSELYRRATTRPAQRQESKPTPKVEQPSQAPAARAPPPSSRDTEVEVEGRRPVGAPRATSAPTALSTTLSRNHSTISVTNARGARPLLGKDSLGPDPTDIPRSRSVSSDYSRTSVGSDAKVRRWVSSSSSGSSLATSQSSKSSEVHKKKFGLLRRISTLSNANLRASAPKSQPLSPTPAYRHRGMKSQEIDINRSINFASADGLEAPALVRAAQAGSRIEVERLIDNGDDIESFHEQTRRTALAVAAHCGNAEVVETLIQLNANLQTRDINLSTPLHLAASRGHTRVLELLLREHVSLEEADDQKRTALWVAAEKGHLDTVGLLLQYKAKVDARSNSQMTALHVAVQQGDAEMTELLIRGGAHIEGRDRCFMTPLHYACEAGHENVVATLLNEKATIEAMGADEKSPLICAAAEGRSHIVDLLLKKKASIRSTDNRGNNALHWAASKGHVTVAEILLQRKLAINDKTSDGLTALHFAVISSQFDAVEYLLRKNAMLESRCRLGRTALHYACGTDNADIVRLLLSAGADAQAIVEGEGLRPIHIAASKGLATVVQLLCEKSVLLDPHDAAGDRPLCLACSYGHAEVVEMLLDFGAQLRLPFGDRSYEDSPLCLAAKGGHKAVVSILLDRGASVRQKDELGWPPIRYAAHYGHPEVLELLLLAANAAGDVPGGPTGLGYDYGGFAATSAISDENKQRVRELLSQAENNSSTYMAERPAQSFSMGPKSSSEPVEIQGQSIDPYQVSLLGPDLSRPVSSRENPSNQNISFTTSSSAMDLMDNSTQSDSVTTSEVQPEQYYQPLANVSSYMEEHSSQPANDTYRSSFISPPTSYEPSSNTYSSYISPPTSFGPSETAELSQADYSTYNQPPPSPTPPVAETSLLRRPTTTTPASPQRSPSSSHNLPIHPASTQYPPAQYAPYQYPPVQYHPPQYPPSQYQPQYPPSQYPPSQYPPAQYPQQPPVQYPPPQQAPQFRSRAEIAQMIEHLQRMLPSIDEGHDTVPIPAGIPVPGAYALPDHGPLQHQPPQPPQQAWEPVHGSYGPTSYSNVSNTNTTQMPPNAARDGQQTHYGYGTSSREQQENEWRARQPPNTTNWDNRPAPQEMP